MKITPLEGWISEHIGANGAGLSRERIEAYQLGRLRETIDWAKARSPFYRERLASVSGRDLGRLEDLIARFPFTTAEDIRRQPLRFLCVSQSEVSRVVTLQTSGTTGDPKRIFFTADDQERTIDFFHHGMSTLAGPGDRILILLPGALPGSVGDLLVKGLERLGAVGVPHGLVREASQTLDVMEKERIDTLVGIPTQVLGLGKIERWAGCSRKRAAEHGSRSGCRLERTAAHLGLRSLHSLRHDGDGFWRRRGMRGKEGLSSAGGGPLY